MPDEVVSTDAADTTTAAPTNTAPWAADLAATFEDEGVRSQVDGFMREKYQPYVTGLEQQVAGLKDAEEYYNDLTSDPGKTWVSLTHEILGDDLAAKVLGALSDEPASTTEAVTAATTETPSTSALAPEDQQLLTEIREKKARDEYTRKVDEFVEAKADPALKAQWFHPFIAAAGGNLDVAYGGYKEWVEDFKAGNTDATPAEAAAETVDEPVPTLNSNTGGAAQIPTEKKYKSMDAAIDDVWKDMVNAAPGTVGSV